MLPIQSPTNARGGAGHLEIERHQWPTVSPHPRARLTATWLALRACTTRDSGVLVVFGITGDLAKLMTLKSLYLLESRGLLKVPVVGVAGDNWTLEHLREHARRSIAAAGITIDDAVFDRFAARLSYVAGDFADPDTYEAVERAMNGAASPTFYLEVPRLCSPWWSKVFTAGV